MPLGRKYPPQPPGKDTVFYIISPLFTYSIWCWEMAIFQDGIFSERGRRAFFIGREVFRRQF
jgi:hypothetical protein